jgi:proteasome lid subunit RPN8/RPN11
MSLVLSHIVWDNMVSHAEEEYPSECCGFFFGNDGEIRKIIYAQRTPNIQTANRKRRFRIDPLEYRKAEKFSAENDLDFLGIYHSHPDHPAEPSEHDRSVAMPFFSYIIIPVSEGSAGEIRSWRLNSEETFEEEQVQLLPGQETLNKKT